MRLSEFILQNIDTIVAEWEVFARSTISGKSLEKLVLRDQAKEIIAAVAHDMATGQTRRQQSDKSKGLSDAQADSPAIFGASESHGVERVDSGFDILEVASEYRALRASVLRLWKESAAQPNHVDVDDITRFNEAIDQSLAMAVKAYTERVNWSRQMFLAILGHDLRNPLNSIYTSAQLLSRQEESGQTSKQIASRIARSAKAMERIISDLLEFAQSVLGGEVPISKTKTNLDQVCQEVVDEIRAAYPTCTLEYDAHGDFQGEWDGPRLRQTLSNVMANAIEYGAKERSIDVTLEEEGSDVLLTVHNEGTPIPQSDLTTIFNPMVRGSASQGKKESKGLGLGLYIAKEVVTSHGGTIEVQSSAELGTNFAIRLPRT